MIFEIGDDTLDSRDIEERIEELESEMTAKFEDQDEEFNESGKSAQFYILEDEIQELADELSILTEFRDEVASSEWPYGLQFVRDEYFQEYARDLAEDTGAINDDSSWPNRCIDWEQAADELQMDYSCVCIDRETYWFLS